MAQTDASRTVTSNETAGAQSSAQLDEAARAFTSQLGDEVSGLGSDTKRIASDFAEEARGTAQAKLSSSKKRAARGFGSVAEALRNSGQQLRSEEQAGLSQYIEGAAEKLERVSDYLQDTDLSEVVQDVESFARREPALFAGGAFALGLIGGRFLKSSQRRATPGVEEAQRASGSGASGVGSGSAPRLKSGGSERTPGAQRGATKSRQGTGKASAAGTGASGEPAVEPDRVSENSGAPEPANATGPGYPRPGDVR